MPTGCGDRKVPGIPKCKKPNTSQLKNHPTHSTLKATNGTGCNRLLYKLIEPYPKDAEKYTPLLLREINKELKFSLFKIPGEERSCVDDDYLVINIKWENRQWKYAPTAIAVAERTLRKTKNKGQIIVGASILFNSSNFKFSYPYLKHKHAFWPDILRHEIGHTFGLPHAPNKTEKNGKNTLTCTMYFSNKIFDQNYPHPTFNNLNRYCTLSQNYAKYMYSQCPNMQME